MFISLISAKVATSKNQNTPYLSIHHSVNLQSVNISAINDT